MTADPPKLAWRADTSEYRGTAKMWKGFTEQTARTSPDSTDPALSGRTYTIPFDLVWNAALALARGDLKGWKLISCDDELGVIRADVRGWILPLEANVLVSVTLDPDAQTRVDMSALGNHRGGDLGVNRRRIRHFFRALDRSLAVRPGQILEPWSSASCAA